MVEPSPINRVGYMARYSDLIENVRGIVVGRRIARALFGSCVVWGDLPLVGEFHFTTASG